LSAPIQEFTRRAAGVLIACTVALTLGPASLIFNTFALLMQPMGGEFGWNRGQTSALVSVLAASYALGSPLKGYLVDRWGARRVVIPMTLAVGCVTAAVGLFNGTGVWLYLLFALIGLLTPGNVPFGKVIGEWFLSKRGLAYGLLGFGFQLAVPVELNAGRLSVDTFGWRAVFAMYGGLQLFVALPLLFSLFRERPIAATGDQPAQTLGGATFKAAMLSSSYWVIVLGLLLSEFAAAGFLIHGVAMLTEKGLSRAAATFALSALPVGAMLAQPILGFFLDRFDTPRVALPFAVAALLGFVLIQTTNAFIPLVVAIGLFGLGGGGETGTTQYYIGRYFGLRHFSTIYGSIQPLTLALALGAGPAVLGFCYDKTGSYDIDFKLMDAALIVAVLLLLLLRKYSYAVGGSAATDGAI
jgi:MFS family permease